MQLLLGGGGTQTWRFIKLGKCVGIIELTTLIGLFPLRSDFLVAGALQEEGRRWFVRPMERAYIKLSLNNNIEISNIAVLDSSSNMA